MRTAYGGLHVYVPLPNREQSNTWMVTNWTSRTQGAVSIRKTVLPGMAIPMLKKDVLTAVLSLTWKSPYVDKTVFILRRGPGRTVCCHCFHKALSRYWWYWSQPWRCQWCDPGVWLIRFTENLFSFLHWPILYPNWNWVLNHVSVL